MATSQIIPDADDIVSEIHFAAEPERVFQAIVDPEKVVQWWQGGVYRCTQFHADLRAGGRWRSVGMGPDGGTFEVTGEYLEVDPPCVLEYTWIASWTGDVRTTVRWELIATNEGTLVRIRHRGLAAHPEVAQSYRGWPRMLGWLQAFLETGETVDSRKPASTS